MNTSYQNSASSLFATMAREEPALPKKNDEVICTKCGSDDTKPVDNEYGIYQCCTCGETFYRS